MSECLEIINRVIKKHGYTYNPASIVRSYLKYYVKGYYCSYTMEITIEECLSQLKFIHNYLKKRGRA